MKKVSLLSLMLICTIVSILTSCESSSEDIEGIENSNQEEKFYAEFEKIKNETNLSFELTEEEYKIILNGDLDRLKKSLKTVTFNSERTVSSNGTVDNFTQPVGPTTATRVVICEQYDNDYHCYPLPNTDRCSDIYKSIPKVDCLEFQ